MEAVSRSSIAGTQRPTVCGSRLSPAKGRWTRPSKPSDPRRARSQNSGTGTRCPHTCRRVVGNGRRTSPPTPEDRRPQGDGRLFGSPKLLAGPRQTDGSVDKTCLLREIRDFHVVVVSAHCVVECDRRRMWLLERKRQSPQAHEGDKRLQHRLSLRLRSCKAARPTTRFAPDGGLA